MSSNNTVFFKTALQAALARIVLKAQGIELQYSTCIELHVNQTVSDVQKQHCVVNTT